MSTHYIAILVPEHGGGWSVLLPDLPGCATHGASVHEAIVTASDAAAGWLAASRERGDEIAAPRPYEDIRRDDEWVKERGLSWTNVVISLIEVRG
jgi:antitoxin HicB